jgi:hypothetical protein
MANDSSTEKKARCGIYDKRPQVCRDYPKVDHYMPEECTFTFSGNERHGECACGVGACCSSPRENGEPGGAALPALAGGKPCKHLVWDEAEAASEKKASVETRVVQPDLYGLVGGPSDT